MVMVMIRVRTIVIVMLMIKVSGMFMVIIKVTVMFMVMITDTVMITDHGINNLVVSVRLLFLLISFYVGK